MPEELQELCRKCGNRRREHSEEGNWVSKDRMSYTKQRYVGPKPPLPKCEICAGTGVDPVCTAGYVAAQSPDQGKTVAWRLICKFHADGWNEGGDWNAPMYKIGERPAFGTEGQGVMIFHQQS